MLRLFDFPDPSAHSPNRQPTTTALQQLFVLNGPLVIRQASALAERLVDNSLDSKSIVRRAYRQLLAREPGENELRLGIEFLDEGGATPDAQTVRQYAQALLGSNELMFVD
jgi:hypothetical protein